MLVTLLLRVSKNKQFFTYATLLLFKYIYTMPPKKKTTKTPTTADLRKAQQRVDALYQKLQKDIAEVEKKSKAFDKKSKAIDKKMDKLRKLAKK